MSSPPPAYNFERIPTVRSRDPLWDAHDEMADPRDERAFDERKETVGTSVLDAEPDRRLPMPEDTLLPLILAIALTIAFVGLLVKSALIGGVGVVCGLVFAAAWIWPKEEFPEARA